MIENFGFTNYKFVKYIYQFIINNGFFYFNLKEYFPNTYPNIKLFFDLILNNYTLTKDIINEQLLEMKILLFNCNDYLLIYLSYILRNGITEFLINKNNKILKKYLFSEYSKFVLLENLIISLKEDEIKYPNLDQYIKVFLDFLINQKNENINMEEAIRLMDIGASLSLLFITLYSNYNYNFEMSLNNESLLELLQNLYKLSNIISSFDYISNISYNKKLILFSLFSIFNVSPIPCDFKLLDKNIFKIYKYINGCLLNYNSILNSTYFFNENNSFSSYFDIFSKENMDIFKDNYIKMFNIEGNNIIINYSIIPIIFRLILSRLVKIITTDFFIEFNKSNQSNSFINGINDLDKSHNSSILFYYNCLNFDIKTIKGEKENFQKRQNSLDYFFNIINKNFSHFNFHFPSMQKEENNYHHFYLNDYFKDIMLYNKVDYEVLYSFLMNYNQKSNNSNCYLLIFLLKEKWNIDFKFKEYFNFKKDKDSIYYYEKLLICLTHIKYEKTNLFISLILLRRLFPKILSLIEFYLEYNGYIFNGVAAQNISNKKKIKIFSYENENIWDGIGEINYFEPMNKDDKIFKIIERIINNYFSALENSMKKFSEFGSEFNSIKNIWLENKNKVNIINYKGKVLYISKKRKSIRFKKKYFLAKRTKRLKYKKQKREELYKKIKETNLNLSIKKDINKILNVFESDENENEEVKDGNKELNETLNVEKEEKKEIIYGNNMINNNIVIHFDKLFYQSSMDKATGKYKKYLLENIIGSFEKAYENKKEQLKIIDNEYYYLFEITFYCIYLDLLEKYFYFIDKKKYEKSFIKDSIEQFISVYEKYSLYINFIEEEGVKTYIKNKYDELFSLISKDIKLYPDNYKTKFELRKYLLNKKQFNMPGNKDINIIEKNVSFINEKNWKKYIPIQRPNMN